LQQGFFIQQSFERSICHYQHCILVYDQTNDENEVKTILHHDVMDDDKVELKGFESKEINIIVN